MNPIHFPEQTEVLAKAQPQYRVLPIAIRYENPEEPESGVMKMTCKYELNELELQQIIATRCVYISQFGDVFHPIYPQTDSPFGVYIISYKVVAPGVYDFFIPMDNGTETVIKATDLNIAIEVLTKVVGCTAEQLHFKIKPSLAVGPGGILELK